MVNRVLPLFLVALALALFLGAPALAADNETHEGKVVSFSNGKLVMTDKDGKEHSHTLADTGKVTIDGRQAKGEDLRPGMRIRVTTPKDDAKTALKIEALDKNKDFEKPEK